MYEADTGIKSGLDTQHAAGIIVVGSLLALILLRRGFRGASLPGIASVKIGG